MQEISMRKQAVKQAFENHSMEVAREALGKTIAQWTAESGRLVTAISALSLSRGKKLGMPIKIEIDK